MRSADVAEWVLTCVMDREHAAAIMGDLEETAITKGSVWFWLSYFKVLNAGDWRAPLAWMAAYGAAKGGGGLVSSHMRFNPFATALSEVDLFLLGLLGFIAVPLWFGAGYVLIRHGAQDRVTQLAILLCILPAAGLLSRDARGLHVATIGIALVVVVALLLRRWRRPALVVTLAVAAANLALQAMVRGRVVLIHWKPSLRSNLSLSMITTAAITILFINAWSKSHAALMKRRATASA